MSLADATVYRKTAQAQAELAQRKGSLAPRARMVLVMVNGVDTAATLIARLGPPAAETLTQLLSLGMIEAVETAPAPAVQRPAGRSTAAAAVPPAASAGRPAVTARAAASAAPARSAELPPTPSPASATPAAAAPPAAASSEPTPRQRATRELLRLLAPHFGPDAPRIAQPALEAADAAGFNAALDGIAARLGIHLGRKAAEQLLAPLRLPS